MTTLKAELAELVARYKGQKLDSESEATLSILQYTLENKYQDPTESPLTPVHVDLDVPPEKYSVTLDSLGIHSAVTSYLDAVGLCLTIPEDSFAKLQAEPHASLCLHPFGIPVHVYLSVLKEGQTQKDAAIDCFKDFAHTLDAIAEAGNAASTRDYSDDDDEPLPGEYLPPLDADDDLDQDDDF